MSRSGYVDYSDHSNWDVIKWSGAVKSALRGRRGQRFLRELAEAMDAMPVKELIADELEHDGGYCALGVLGAARGLDLGKIAPEDECQVSKAFDIARALAMEVMFENDECGNYGETPARRWVRMRRWVEENLKEDKVG